MVDREKNVSLTMEGQSVGSYQKAADAVARVKGSTIWHKEKDLITRTREYKEQRARN